MSEYTSEAHRILTEILPARALQHLRDTGSVSEDMLKLYGIGDSEIGSLLNQQGIDVSVIVRTKIEELLSGVVTGDRPVFEIVNEQTSGENNPLLTPVIELLSSYGIFSY